MSFRPRAKPTAQLSAGSDGGTRGAAERLSSVLAVGTASFPLALRIPTNAGEHGSSPRLNVDGDEKDLIIEELKKMRRGDHVVHKRVDITKHGLSGIIIGYEVPDGIDLDMYPADADSLVSNRAILWQTSGTEASPYHGRFLSNMRDVIAHLFPGNPISEFVIQLQRQYDSGGLEDSLPDKLFGFIYLTNNFGVAGDPNGNLDLHTSTAIAEAFLVSTINDSIGRDCYVANRSVAKKLSASWSFGVITYHVHIVLADDGECASHRVVGRQQ